MFNLTNFNIFAITNIINLFQHLIFLFFNPYFINFILLLYFSVSFITDWYFFFIKSYLKNIYHKSNYLTDPYYLIELFTILLLICSLYYVINLLYFY